MLTFHRVSRAADWASRPNRDFYIDAAFLGGLLDHLRRSDWDVVTMDDALRRLSAPTAGRRFVNFSIDDTYRDTAELAVPVFRARGVPVTQFDTTGIPDGTMPLWTAGLETVLQERDDVVLPSGEGVLAPDGAAKRALYSRVAAEWESADAAALCAELCARNGFAVEEVRERHAITWPMLEALRRDPLVEIGGHTISHPRLSTLPDGEAEREIAGCRSRLQQRLGLPVRHFAFPFGRSSDCGEREFAIAERAGYATAATTRKGVIRHADARRLYALPRNTLNGAHRNVRLVDAHLSGLSGLATALLRAG